MHPLIGLTTSEIRHPDPAELIPHADAGREEVVLGRGYFSALAAGGGAPVVMPPLDPELVPSFLSGMAGVCLSGGPDVDPDAYGGERHPKLGPTQPDVRRVGDGLRAVARAPDGVVEALEAPDADFELGVQWHPEAIADRPEQAALFAAFVDAAGRYAARTESTARTAAASQRPGSPGDSAIGATGIR